MERLLNLTKNEEIKNLLSDFASVRKKSLDELERKRTDISEEVFVSIILGYNGRLEALLPVKDEEKGLQKLLYEKAKDCFGKRELTKTKFDEFISLSALVKNPAQLPDILNKMMVISSYDEFREAKITVPVFDLYDPLKYFRTKEETLVEVVKETIEALKETLAEEKPTTDKDRIYKLFEKGYTTSQVADGFGINKRRAQGYYMTYKKMKKSKKI